MPIEIRELVIKATVSQSDDGSPGGSGSGASTNDVSSSEEIISACVEKILQILKEKNER